MVSVLYILYFNTVNKSECIKHVVFLNVHWMSYHGMLPYSLLTSVRDYDTHTHTYYIFAPMRHTHTHTQICIISHGYVYNKMSMGIVGVNSTAGREVKFIDPSKTTKSESSWLGYTLCDLRTRIQRIFLYYSHTHTHIQIYRAYAHTCVSNTLQWRTKVGGSKRIRYPRRPICYIKRWALNCISLQIC